MIQTLILSIIDWVQSLGWVGVFLGSVLEEIIPPIPSTLTQLTYGAILFKGATLNAVLIGKAILWVGIPAACGVLVGSLPFYAIGYFLGKPFIDRFGKWIGVSWDSIEELETKFHKNHWDDVIFTGLRAIPIIPSIVLSIGPGVLRLPLRTYIIGTLIGTFIRASVMGSVGAVIGSQLGTFAETIDRLGSIGTIVFGITTIIMIAWYLRGKHLTRKKNRIKNATEK